MRAEGQRKPFDLNSLQSMKLAAELYIALNATVTSLLTQPAVALALNLRRRFVTAQENN